MDNHSKGMSRAAKRRRKESLKGSENSSSDRKVVESGPVLTGSSIFNDWNCKQNPDCSILDSTILSTLNKIDVIDILAPDRAQTLLSLLIAPVSRTDFYSQFWQSTPLHIENSKKMAAFADIYKRKDLDEIINRHLLRYSEDILLGKYYEGIQIYMGEDEDSQEDQGGANKAAEISGTEVWRACSNGYSFQLFNLHKYNDNMWRLLSALEHEFNAPLKSQVTVTSGHFVGFGPALADGDEFIIQVEGSELYNIYCSIRNHSVSSSGPEKEQWPPTIDAHKVVTDTSSLPPTPFLTAELSTGDMLYVPRGWVIEVLRPSTKADKRSAHLTISTNHKNNLLTLAEAIFPQAILLLEQRGSGVPLNSSTHTSSGSGRANRLASASSVAVRALPRQFLSFMGVAKSEEDEDPRRDEFKGCFKRVLDVMQETMLDLLDPVADQVLKKCSLFDNSSPQYYCSSHGCSMPRSSSFRVYQFL